MRLELLGVIMPPDTLWTGNPNLEVTVSEGNIAFDSGSTSYDAPVDYDGAAPANLIPLYTPSDTLWTEQAV